MKVLFDYQVMCSQKFGGISRYYYDLLRYMKHMNLADADVQCVLSRNKYFEKYFRRKASDYNRVVEIGVKLLNQILTIPKLVSGKYDIIQPTYYDPYLLKFAKGKVVFTVYDMIQELFPEIVVPVVDRTIPRKKKLLHKCDHIIAISESTKRDILKLYPDIPEDKISVIYIGSSFKYTDAVPTDITFPERYILFVGRREAYKNFENFFRAVKPILKKDKSLHLVCVGGGAFNESEQKKLAGVEDQVMQLNANDEVLAYAYSHAECFVFPSKYEGFGIPTLEAFTCNCPVVLSNTSSMPEVGGDAAVYFDPENVAEMNHQINKVLNDEELRKEMIEKGKVQLKKFSWKKITKQIVDCYEKVLNQ
ncbi:MAG: glycosyltransferase family 4 protein [Lachnospiraceae bacterium]|nr:glycosyltransferase family 4 protein [Lachnospiraceae bacterium]